MVLLADPTQQFDIREGRWRVFLRVTSNSLLPSLPISRLVLAGYPISQAVSMLVYVRVCDDTIVHDVNVNAHWKACIYWYVHWTCIECLKNVFRRFSACTCQMWVLYLVSREPREELWPPGTVMWGHTDTFVTYSFLCMYMYTCIHVICSKYMYLYTYIVCMCMCVLYMCMYMYIIQYYMYWEYTP